ncbi:hypothetical protein IQ07DRAFT_76847 [Pyrenochaeta sp. DS3sAY3a]|nr:hypothetical protein IQ07DRAFT_76847 [Pyrenochaeta sp. DS3sAY3a]
MGDSTAESSSGRVRSFGGCATCRHRHMKCDEGRPACLGCKNAGLVCGGYAKNIFFDFEDAPETAGVRFRRPLLTEEERKAMSEWLTTAVPSLLVNQTLSQIDEECGTVTFSRTSQVSRGPFGAFRIFSAEPSPQSIQALEEPSPAWLNADAEGNDEQPLIQHNLDDDVFTSDMILSPGTQELIQTIFDVSQYHPKPSPVAPFFDMLDVNTDSGRIQEIFDEGLMTGLSNAASSHDPKTFQFPHFPSNQVSPSTFCNTGHLDLAVDAAVPQDAVFLLRHYQTTILPFLTPFRHSKTPWHILFVPHAKSCLAALTLGETMDHAGLCSFYGTLAISAFSLWGISNSQTWLEQGRRYKQQAREQVRLMLQTAYDIPKTAKYKSILMALLTMVQLSMVTGNRDQTECYFLQAEKFIRFRGLRRRKSRKVRLLHHCYAFERILHESSFVGTQNTSYRRHVSEAVKSSGLVIYGQDSGSFRLGKWNNLAEDMMRVKGQDEGENDLHLEYPGIWSATLYPEIFGVQEMWLFLVSLVIRLAKEKEVSEKDGTAETLSVKDYLSRAKAIEKCILQLKQTRSSECQTLNNMLDAMEHALLIFFYRKIYDVESSLLQQRVVSVRDCLVKFETGNSEEVFGTTRLVWPAFIAASEAEDSDVQASFATWFRLAAQRSGLRLFSDTLENLERAWQEKIVSYGILDTCLET